MVGEKWGISESASEQLDGVAWMDVASADAHGLFVGFEQWSDLRSTGGYASPGVYLPFQNGHGLGWPNSPFLGFGSAHPNTMNAAFCDGSVQAISYDIDPETYLRKGLRDDGGKGLEPMLGIWARR